MGKQAVKYDRGSPTIVIRIASKLVNKAALKRALRAIQKQVDRDFFPRWGWRAKLLLEPKLTPKNAMVITIKNREEGSLDGYHIIDGVPRTFVFVLDGDGKPVDYFATLSHEVLEMIADPGINLFAEGTFTYLKHKRRGYVAYEVCDPVQESFYEIDGIRVSDFVLPEWFEEGRKPSGPRNPVQFSFCKSVNAPFKLAVNGYFDFIYRGRLRTLWGPAANVKKRRHRHKVRAER